jgi:hypothetical protein
MVATFQRRSIALRPRSRPSKAVAYYCDLMDLPLPIEFEQQHLRRLRSAKLAVAQSATPQPTHHFRYLSSVTVRLDHVFDRQRDMAAASAAPHVELPPGQFADRRCRHGQRTIGEFRHASNILRTSALVERVMHRRVSISQPSGEARA